LIEVQAPISRFSSLEALWNRNRPKKKKTETVPLVAFPKTF